MIKFCYSLTYWTNTIQLNNKIQRSGRQYLLLVRITIASRYCDFIFSALSAFISVVAMMIGSEHVEPVLSNNRA